MPGPEQKPELIHADEIEPTELPVRVDDGKDTVIVHKNNSGTIFMRYWHEEQSVVSVAITEGQITCSVSRWRTISPSSTYNN
jgi:hypothetical protein